MATIELTADTFVSTTSAPGIVLVDFWASWCGPCMRFGPIYEATAEKYPDIVFGKVDTETQQSLAAAANIRSIPTLFAFREGILVFSQPGALPGQALEALIAAIQDLDMDDVRRQIAGQAEAGAGAGAGAGGAGEPAAQA